MQFETSTFKFDDLLIEQQLPLSVFTSVWKILNGSVNSTSNLLHFALYVKEERFLAKIGINDFSRSL